MLNYGPHVARLPVRELSLTQAEPGDAVLNVALAATDDVVLIRSRVSSPSVCVAILEPDYTAFTIALPLAGALVINGATARPGMLFSPVDNEAMYVRGGARETTTVFMRRDCFEPTVAALRGEHPEDRRSFEQPANLSPTEANRLHRQLDHLLEGCGDGFPHMSAERFSDQVIGLLAAACLCADRGPVSDTERTGRAHRIVRRAEERFVQASGKPVSLADLCAAAGVSASTLYRAFDIACGVPPLEYFHKRRLMKARLNLIGAPPARGAVKRAALDAGLGELGRFAVEYRRLFGEPPSATLRRVCPADAGERRSAA